MRWTIPNARGGEDVSGAKDDLNCEGSPKSQEPFLKCDM